MTTTEEHLEFRHRVTPAPTRYLRRMHLLSDDANGIVVKYNSTKQMNLIRWKRAEWIAYWELIGCYDHLNIDDDALLDLARTRVQRSGSVWDQVVRFRAGEDVSSVRSRTDKDILRVKARVRELFGLHVNNEPFPDFVLEYFKEHHVHYRRTLPIEINGRAIGEVVSADSKGYKDITLTVNVAEHCVEHVNQLLREHGVWE